MSSSNNVLSIFKRNSWALSIPTMFFVMSVRGKLFFCAFVSNILLTFVNYSPETEDGNEMVFCDRCNICVHQACYGITEIPDDEWLCSPCRSSKFVLFVSCEMLRIFFFRRS